MPDTPFIPLHRRLGVRLLAVNALILLLPYFSLRVAHTYERHLLMLTEDAMIREGQVLAAALAGEREPDLPGPPTLNGAAARARLARIPDRYAHPRIWVFSADGRFVADTYAEKPEAFRERPADRAFWSLPEVRAALGGRYGSSARTDPAGRQVILTSVLPLQASGRVTGFLVLAQPTGRIMAALREYKQLTKRVFLLSALLAAIVTLFLSWSILRPLDRLIAQAGRVERGDWEASLSLPQRDEIGRLSSAFEAMKEKLRAHLASTRRLALDISHRFKTPLTSIRGAAEILGSGGASDPEIRARLLRNIQEDAHRLDALLNRLLLLAGIEDPGWKEDRQVVDATLFLKGLRDRFEPAAAAKGVALALNLLPDPCPAGMFPGLMETALENVLDNAVKFTPAGGRVVLSLERGPRGILIRVENTGGGIPTENLGRIFERFYSTRSPSGAAGNGLGLAIAKAAVERHGGTISVESSPTGTIFTLFIPAM